MGLSYAPMVLTYWLFLCGIIYLAGAFTSKLLVTGPSGADAFDPGGGRPSLAETAGKMAFYCALFLFVINLMHMFFHAAQMTDTPLGEVHTILRPFLLMTKYGKFVLIRTLLIVGLMGISFMCIKRPGRWGTALGVVFALAAIITISMSSHTGAKGYTNLPFALNVVHIIAITLWVGGLFYVRGCFKCLMGMSPRAISEGREMINRFSALATVCVGVALASGVALAYLNIKSPSILIDVPYGRVLVVKVLLVGVMALLGAANKFYTVPLLNSADEDDHQSFERAKHRLQRMLTVESVVGLAVLLATAILAHLAPEG